MQGCQLKKSNPRLVNPSSEYQVCRGVADDYDHGKHRLARATVRLDAPGLVTRAGLAALTLPDTDALIVDELTQASDTNLITRVLADAALLDLDRRAHPDEVMGIEGVCSNAYFDALAACVPADVTFDGCSRRPPRDLSNAALYDGYAILLSECVGALHAAGLEPSLGIVHAPTDKRPSLALDLMEQFRPVLVDQTVMALLRTRKHRPEHGVIEADAGECGWVVTARKSSSTRTRPPASDPSPAPCPDTRDRSADTSPTPRRCWRAPSANPTTRGAGAFGDDLHHRLRHRRQQTAATRRQNAGILGLPHPRIRVPTPP